jgi:hypothetical protein
MFQTSSISDPSIAGNTLYVTLTTHARDQLDAFDLTGTADCSATSTTCSPMWTGSGLHATTNAAGPTAPAINDGIVALKGNDGYLYAFDAAGVKHCTGTPAICTPLWMTGAINPGSPAIANGILYTVGGDGTLNAYDDTGVQDCSGASRTCTPMWTATANEPLAQTQPAVANSIIYVGTNNRIGTTPVNEIVAFDATGMTSCTGAPSVCHPIWHTPVDGVMNEIAVSDHALYFDVQQGGGDHGTLATFGRFG